MKDIFIQIITIQKYLCKVFFSKLIDTIQFTNYNKLKNSLRYSCHASDAKRNETATAVSNNEAIILIIESFILSLPLMIHKVRSVPGNVFDNMYYNVHCTHNICNTHFMKKVIKV